MTYTIEINDTEIIVNGIRYDRNDVEIIIKPNSFQVFDLKEPRYLLLAFCNIIPPGTATTIEHSIEYFNQCMETRDITTSNIHELLAIQEAHPEHPFPIVLRSNAQTWFALFRENADGTLSMADVLTYDPEAKSRSNCFSITRSSCCTGANTRT